MFPTLINASPGNLGQGNPKAPGLYKEFELEVQPGITEADPTEFIKVFPVCKIEKVTIHFKPGPNYEVYVQIRHETKALFPEDPFEWITGENTDVVITGPWEDWDNVYRLRIRMCSPQARLPHKIIFRFDLGAASSQPVGPTSLDSLTSNLIPVSEAFGLGG